MVDAENGMLGLEWVDGVSVRRVLGGSEDEDGGGSGGKEVRLVDFWFTSEEATAYHLLSISIDTTQQDKNKED